MKTLFGLAGRMVMLWVFFIVGLMNVSMVQAQWQVVDDSAIEVRKSEGLLHRIDASFVAEVEVRNTSNHALPGQYRIVVQESNKALLEADGETLQAEPYLFIIAEPDGSLQAGQSIQKRIRFQPTRGRLHYQVRLERMLPAVAQAPQIQVLRTLEFQNVVEHSTQQRALRLINAGTAPLTISALRLDPSDFDVAIPPGLDVPLRIQPGQTQNVTVSVTAPRFDEVRLLSANLLIDSDDPARPSFVVRLQANVTPPTPNIINHPVTAVQLTGPITADNCTNVTGTLTLTDAAQSGDQFTLVLADQGQQSAPGGQRATSPLMVVPGGFGQVSIAGIDACGLADGILAIAVHYHRDGEPLASLVIGSVVKNTSSLNPPVLAPVEPVSVSATVEVCGHARANTRVQITGGAQTVAVDLDALTTAFCVDVPLRRNTQNSLIASAIDTLAEAPRPIATAPAVSVVHVDPSEIVIADVASRPLSEQEVDTLVQQGILDLDDPSNFNVSLFTIVLTIGSFPVTLTEYVITHGGGTAQGGSTVVRVNGSGGGSGRVRCETICTEVVVIPTPGGQVIPGVLVTEGRIKTLKELFQVTLLIQNTSSSFLLTDMNTSIELPSGLNLLASGLGMEVQADNLQGARLTLDLGDIAPGETGVGQFIVRGDAIGSYEVGVQFAGFLTEGGLPQPFPVNGAAATLLQVEGPPEMGVVVRYPSDPNDFDVKLNEIFDVFVELTNLSTRPALYTSLELFIGGDFRLLDEQDQPIETSSSITSFGTLYPGQTQSVAFRVKSLVEGEIIACQALAAQNLQLTIDLGPDPDGVQCGIANTYPANLEPLDDDLAPSLLGINPLHGQTGVPLTSSIVAVFTPPTSCLVADTWQPPVIQPIGGDSSLGNEIIFAELVGQGTFYLQELDSLDQVVKNIPVDLNIEHSPAGGITTAVLRLGLDDPISQYFLKPATRYRATLDASVCSAASGAPMGEPFQWTFTTETFCLALQAPRVSMEQPQPGSILRPLNQSIVLAFSETMNPASFRFTPGNLSASSIGVYANAVTDSQGNDIVTEGTALSGSWVFDRNYRRLTFSPANPLPEDSQIIVRVTNTLQDECNNALQTPPSGVSLFRFTTILPDTTPPEPALVNPLPALTRVATVQVSGAAEPHSRVTVFGGAAEQTTVTSSNGRFSVVVPLQLDQSNTLQVQASDASGNRSALVNSDRNGDPLVIHNDSQAPLVIRVSPADGTQAVALDTAVTLSWNETIQATTVNTFNFYVEDPAGVRLNGTFDHTDPTQFRFIPAQPLAYGQTYTVGLRAGGVQDSAGNGLANEFLTQFTTVSIPVPVVDQLSPSQGVQGSNFTATIQGMQLDQVTQVRATQPGVGVNIVARSEQQLTVQITVDRTVTPGDLSLEVINPVGMASVPFTVQYMPPMLDQIRPSHGRPGDTIQAIITGDGLGQVTSLTTNTSSVVVTDLGSSNTTQRQVSFSVDALATTGVHTVTLTTPGGSVQGTFTVVASLIEPLMDIQLQAGEDRVLPISIAPDAAPPGGLSLSVQVSNPALVSVPSQIFIPEGSTQTELRLLAASTAVGETVITIESPVLPAVSLNVVVSNEVTTQDGIKIIDSLNDAVMVASMAKVYSVLLGRSDHGGVNIQLSSNRTDTVLFSALEVADSAMPSPVYELFVPDGMSRADFLVHGAPLASGSAILTATHDDFLPAQLTVTLVQPSVDLVIAGVLSLSNLLSEFLQPNALSPNLPLTLSMTYDGCQTPADLAGLPCGFDRLFVSPLAGSLPVELHSSDSDVAGFVSANQFSATHTIEVPIYTNSVPAFGVESTLAIDFVSAGTATLSATIAGYAQGSGFTPVTLTVSKPAISILPTRLTPLAVGEEASYQLLLLPSGFSLIGSQSGHDALTVSVSSDDPAAIQLASEPGGVFQDTIELTIPANQFSATFQVRGVQASPDANILITDDAFQPASFPVPVTNVPLTFSSQPIQQEQTNITEE